MVILSLMSARAKKTDKKHSLFEQIYYKLFFSNTKEINYKNIIRLYKKN